MSKKGRLFVISGPSGVGKTTLSNYALKRLSNLVRSVSLTTRQIRKGERQGIDYNFVRRKEFLSMQQKGLFLETVEILGELYGTSRRLIEAMQKRGKDILLCIDVNGARQIQRLKEDVVSIFIMPPSIKELRQRLKRRRTPQKEMRRRIALAKEEIKKMRYYDYCIVNDLVSRAAKDLVCIISAERLRIRR